jgi:hypothetical protein
VLYLIVSESANVEKIAVHDNISGGEITASLAPGRVGLVLLSRADGHILAWIVD